MQTEHHAQLQEFEEELKKQRDRTVSMLAEKEREIETLRATSTQRIQSDYIMRYRYKDFNLTLNPFFKLKFVFSPFLTMFSEAFFLRVFNPFSNNKF